MKMHSATGREEKKSWDWHITSVLALWVPLVYFVEKGVTMCILCKKNVCPCWPTPLERASLYSLNMFECVFAMSQCFWNAFFFMLCSLHNDLCMLIYEFPTHSVFSWCVCVFMCFDVSLLSGCVCVFFLWKLFLYALVCFICFASPAVFGDCLYMFFFSDGFCAFWMCPCFHLFC